MITRVQAVQLVAGGGWFEVLWNLEYPVGLSQREICMHFNEGNLGGLPKKKLWSYVVFECSRPKVADIGPSRCWVVSLGCPGARCSSVVRAFAHGAMGRLINPSWWTHWAISRSCQCSTTGVTMCYPVCGMVHIKAVYHCCIEKSTLMWWIRVIFYSV